MKSRTEPPTPEALYLWAASRCAVKEYCRSEIKEKFLQKGATVSVAETLIERLEKERYIDEERYARAFVSDKFRFAHWGRVKIRYALQLKGISPQLIDEALSLVQEESYQDELRAFIQSRRRTVKADSPYALKQKLARAAISRGFEPSAVFAQLSELADISDEEDAP